MVDYRRALGFRLGHRIRPNGGQMQDPDAEPEADRDEMGSVQRRSRHEACGLTRIRPVGPVVDQQRSPMPQMMK